MKTIILFTIILVPSAFAKIPVTGDKANLKSAVDHAGRIATVVASAGVPRPVCTEEIHNLNRPVLTRDPNVPVIVCRPDSTSLTTATGEDYSQLIRDYNIEFAGNQATITATREWRLFVHELRKFPPALMREMAGQGGKIRVMIGNGVSEDPQWDVERQRALTVARDYRNWYNRLPQDQRAGKTLPQSDEQVNRGFTFTSEGGRKWDVVSGAGGVFMNPDSMSPTRIVLNRMYRSAHRMPDDTIVEADQGSVNLFLHEHGHALDNLYGHHTISSTQAWKDVLADEKVKTYVPKIFSTYENGFEEEGFAEAFAYYHSCEASRTQMEREAPALANFFKNFQTVREHNPTMYQSWRRQHNR